MAVDVKEALELEELSLKAEERKNILKGYKDEAEDYDKKSSRLSSDLRNEIKKSMEDLNKDIDSLYKNLEAMNSFRRENENSLKAKRNGILVQDETLTGSDAKALEQDLFNASKSILDRADNKVAKDKEISNSELSEISRELKKSSDRLLKLYKKMVEE